MTLFFRILQWLDEMLINFMPAYDMPPQDLPMNQPTQVETTTEAPITEPKPTYDWSTPDAVHHSCRVIMDEYGLTWNDKDILCACIMQESEFNPKAIGRLNSDGTRDYGLLQFNNGKNPKTGAPYWIGPGAAFKDIDEVLNNPEKNVRIFIKEYTLGHISYWSSYKTGAYKKWL